MKIEVFGTGCAKCKTTKTIIKDVLEKHNFSAELLEVSKIDEIIERGIIMTPAVAIDGKIMVTGRIPSEDEILKLLGI